MVYKNVSLRDKFTTFDLFHPFILWSTRVPSLSHALPVRCSTETLATMIKQLLPETLSFLHETNSRCLGALYSTSVEGRVYGLTETQCFVNLLSAVLERNAPKVDSTFTHTATVSGSSRISSSRLIDSRSSSALLSAYRYHNSIRITYMYDNIFE